MISFYDQLSNILTAPPGNLVYHLALIFVLVISLQAVLSRRFDPQIAGRGRVILSITLMLTLQVGLFLASAFTWQGIANQHLYLPPLDRFITAMSFILLVWIWNFPKTGRFVDTITLLLSLIVVILFIFTLSAWSTQPPAAVFNASWLDWGWSVFSIFILFSGLLILLLQKPAAWGTGLIIFGVNIAAFTAHLIWEISAGNYSPLIRIAQLVTFPLIPSLVYKLQEPAKEKTVTKEEPSTHLTLEQTWLSSIDQSESLNMIENIAHTISVDMKADACVLIEAAGNELNFLGGYDRYHNQTIGYRSIDSSNLLLLREIIRNGEPERWSQKDTPAEKFDSLAGYIGLKTPQEEICFAPIGKRGNKEYWSIISLSEQSTQKENELQQCLLEIQEPALKIFEHFEAQKELEFRVSELEVSLANTRSELENMTRKKNLLEEQMNELIADEADLDALTSLQNELTSLLSTITDSNNKKQSAFEKKPEGETTLQRIAQLEVMLDQAHADSSFLKENLRQASRQMLALQEKLTKSKKITQDYAIESQIIQDAGTKPAAVIDSYFDPSQVIDRVIDDVSMMLLEKELNLKLAIPVALPAIQMEEDAFAQLLERGFTFLADRTDTRGSLILHSEVPADSTFLSLHIAQQGSSPTPEPASKKMIQAQEEDSYQAENTASEDFKMMERIVHAQGGQVRIESDRKNISIQFRLPLGSISYTNSRTQTRDL